MEKSTPSKATWLVTAAFFAFCVAPTFISYTPYEFSWDDSDYLMRAMAVNRAFWAGDVHGLGAAMVSYHTPVMTFFGLPWVHLATREAAGDCFFTLAAVTALLAAVCLYLLLRIGVKPILLVAAGICVGASLGPYQAGPHATHMHELATRFLSDTLFAWTALAAILLIPYEARTPCPSLAKAALRGLFCASIFSLGALTKVSFFYFIALIFPVVAYIRFRTDGIKCVLVWLVTFFFGFAPTAFYFLRYGRIALSQGQSASFGGLADFYHVPLRQFLAGTFLESPGSLLSLALLGVAGIYVLLKKRPRLMDSAVIALLIMIGYLVIVLASPSKQIRYLFPVMVALPFLTVILLSDQDDSVPAPWAWLLPGFVFLGLLAASMPTRNRPYQQSLADAQAILDQAGRCHAKSVLLATDSPTLNVFLLNLTAQLSSSQTSVGTLAYQAMHGAPIQDDFATIDKSDIVVFQDAPRLRPKFTNQRGPQYQQHIQQQGLAPTRLGDDLNVYAARCNL